MAKTRVILHPSGIAAISAKVDRTTARVVEDVERDARRLCPTDTHELVSTIRSETNGRHGRVIVGTDHWAAVEYGARPHVIHVRHKRVLSNGEEFFGREVLHPGNPPQPFMRPALYRKRVLR